MNEPGSAPEASDRGADIPPSEFRRAMHRVADMVADYLERVGRYPVLPDLAPGDVRRSLPAVPPLDPEPLDRILDDYRERIEPAVTHWNHPGFLAYFAITGSAPGILAEALAAALNVNAMLWRTGPAATELEELVVDWLRQMIGLPAEFRGCINDTASIGTLLALATARHRIGAFAIGERGMSGRPELPELVIYTSEQAHSSVDKAAILLGIGRRNVRHVAVDAVFRLDPAGLARAIHEDRAAGRFPLACVATVGTTSTTSVDPVDRIAETCRREGLWLHVDAAYAGSAAICPELRRLMPGLELADSIVLNPHKWLFTPLDCSVLLVRDVELLRAAFSLVPEYLRSDEAGGTNLMDYGVQLGRRFRALKLWMVIRAFGVAGLRERIRHHCELARRFAGWVEADVGFELAAPVPFSTVCFRARVDGTAERADQLNEALLGELNRSGRVFLSHTKLAGRYTLRLAIGNLRTRAAHIEEAWTLIRIIAERLRREPREE